MYALYCVIVTNSDNILEAYIPHMIHISAAMYSLWECKSRQTEKRSLHNTDYCIE